MMTEVEITGEIMDVRDGTHDSPTYVDDGYPLITSKNLKNGKIVLDEVNLISKEDYIKINKRSKVDKGDILYSMIGTIGNFSLVEEVPHYAIKNVALFKFNKDIVFNKYFFYVLSSDFVKRQIEEQQKGGTQKFVTLKILRNLKIPLPPLTTQIHIAGILDDAAALRDKTAQLIKEYDLLAQSIFLDMFGDPVTNPRGWEFRSLKSLTSILGDGLHGTPKYDENGEYYFVNGNNLVDGNLVFTDKTKKVAKEEYKKYKKKLNENTMLVSINGTIGKVAFYNGEKIVLGKSACYFNVKKELINFVFLYRIINSDYFLWYANQRSTGSTIKNVSLKTMREFPITCPPLHLQNEFAEKIALIEQQKELAKQELKESEDLFNCLLQKAFKGELIEKEEVNA